MLYPIQVHGIVLSAGDDLVTICDFGLTAVPRQHDHEHDHEPQNDDINITPHPHPEDLALMQACEAHHQKQQQQQQQQRMNIWTLTEQKEIKRWRKVNYGEPSLSLNSRHRHWGMLWKSRREDTVVVTKDHDNDHDKTSSPDEPTVDQNDESAPSNTNTHSTNAGNKANSIDSITIMPPPLTHHERGWIWWKKSKKEMESQKDVNIDNDASIGIGSCTNTSDDGLLKRAHDEPSVSSPPTPPPTKTDTTNTTKNNAHKITHTPSLAKCDPANIVLARVRYLLHHPDHLPPHHIFYSNSECIAVWCKTGRWSTLQASVYLHSTAAGNLKTSIVAASGLAHATTAVTTPAAGVAGWFGYTTTATVSLVSVQPWLIPLVAGYGILAVGTPILLLKQARARWERTTIELNNAFWSLADTDVFVEAIQSWSSVR